MSSCRATNAKAAQGQAGAPVSKTIHMCLDLRGALTNWGPRQTRGVLRDESGRALSHREVREWLLDQMQMGRKVVPYGKPCEGFSYETGCPGHEESPP